MKSSTSKETNSIPVLKQNEIEIRNEQNRIAPQNALPVFHYSDNQARGFATDPKLFGQHSFTKNDARYSKEPRSFFYTSQKQVMNDHPALKGKQAFMGVVDVRKIYDFSKNAMNYGVNEYGNVDIDEAIKDAKADGWQGIRYGLMGGEVINMFKPVYVERLNGTPSVGEILSNKWNTSVEEARKRLNSGFYGSKLMDATAVPAMGLRFVSDMGMIMADHLLKTKTKFGTPEEFAQKLFDMYEDKYPIVRRYARQIYEYAKSIREDMKKSPLSLEDAQDLHAVIAKQLTSGQTGEYIPTGKGVIVLGGMS